MAASENNIIAQVTKDKARNTFFYKDYSQTPLISAFRNYLELQGADEKTKNCFILGLCFGLSLVFSTFHNQAKAKWWTSLLKQIINHQHLFSKKGYLDEMATDWHLPDSRELQSHRQLIERALNYAQFSHARIWSLPSHMQADINNEALNQSIYFEPKKKSVYLSGKKVIGLDINHEYMTNKGLRSITSFDQIAGYFTEKLLILSIEQKDTQENIVKISNNTHCCALVFDKDTKEFGFYNPNNPTGEAIWFKSKPLLAKHIIKELGNQLKIAAATTKKIYSPLFQNFYQAIDDPKIFASFLSNNNTAFMNTQSPHLRKRLSKYISLTPSFYESLILSTISPTPFKEPSLDSNQEYLMKLLFFPSISEDSVLPQAASLLNTKTNGHTLLYVMLMHSPEAFNQLSQRMKNNKIFINSLKETLHAWQDIHWCEMRANPIMKKMTTHLLKKCQENDFSPEVFKELKLISSDKNNKAAQTYQLLESPST